LSRCAPLTLVVDDAHWADGGTLFLLRYLARRIRLARLPLLLVLTYREVELDETLRRSWLENVRDNREIVAAWRQRIVAADG
jgi:predicted ATPase